MTLPEQMLSSNSDGDSQNDGSWSRSAMTSILLFVVAGIFEIGGGWLVWKGVREGASWHCIFWGCLILMAYGFIPTFQPKYVVDCFGRVYAVYGGFFIALSAIWGWLFDGDRPDLGDVVGGTIALTGVLVILFWPRRDDDNSGYEPISS